MPSSPKSPKDEDNFLPTSISNRSSFGLSTGASSSSLAQYYIPDKITSSPSYWGSEARTASRKAAGGWGAAAGPRRTSQGSASALNVRESYRGNGVLFNPAYQETSGSSSAIYTLNNPHSTRSSLLIGPPSSGHRNRKWGAGRDAWGQDGGGNPALGAGGFEDDDGLDLTQDRYGREQRHPLGAEAAPASTTTGNSPPASELMPSLMAAPTSITGKRIRWNRFKWTLVAANSLLTIYSVTGFVAVILFWTGMYRETKVLDIINRTEMTLGLIAMIICLFVCIIGWAGILLNNRSFLAVYTFLLWIAFIFIVAPGYIAYKSRTFNLSGKMNQIWSNKLSVTERQTIQRVLHCCGYYSPYIEAAADSFRCFSRSTLPGCKGSIVDFERKALQYVYICCFAIVPAHLGVIIASLLCSDHITYRFGKGVTPKEYRVDDTVIQSALLKQSQFGRSPGDVDEQEKSSLLPSPRPPFWSQSSQSPSGTQSPANSSNDSLKMSR